MLVMGTVECCHSVIIPTLVLSADRLFQRQPLEMCRVDLILTEPRLLVNDQVAVVDQIVEYLLIGKCSTRG